MIPLFTNQQVREADKYAVNNLKIPSILLMENASRSVFEIIIKNYPEIDTFSMIGIICGKGNNGGDGYALARHFINEGLKVIVVSLADENELTPDAKINYQILRKLLNVYTDSQHIFFKSTKDLTKLSDCSIIIDAMLGTGITGDLAEPYRGIVDKINELNSIKIAIDIPTGLNADTGAGEVIFNADLTITLGELKRGLFFSKGYIHSGDVEKGYIGIGNEYFSFQEIEDFLVENTDALQGLPVKKPDIYKYSAGKVFVIAGSGLMPGASVFAANAAMKAGAGAVYLAFPLSLKPLVQGLLDAAITFAYDDFETERLSEQNVDVLMEKIKWADCVVLGPGLGRDEETVKAVWSILNHTRNKNMVIDADAIWAIKNFKYRDFNLENKIFTPHHREFCELINIDLKELHQNVLYYGKSFAQETKSYLVLKGAPTITFFPDGKAYINTTGNPGMAKFGTGDVLSGIIAGLISQSGYFEAALLSSVYIHSHSADLLLENLTEFSILPNDIINNLPSAIKNLREKVD